MKCLQIVLNPFTHDSRVIRTCQTLAASGHEVVVFALHEEPLPTNEVKAFATVRRVRLGSRGWLKHPFVQVLKYAECALRQVRWGLAEHPDVVHANDLEALPIGYAIARLAGAKLIYDAHELWEDVASTREYPILLLRVLRFLERTLARRADAVITVSSSIARRMANRMLIREPVVLRNVPVAKPRAPDRGNHRLRHALGLNPSVPIVLYQGGIARDYGVETLVAAMEHVAPPTVAVLLGNGPSVPALRSEVAQHGLQRRVFFHRAVPPEDVLDFTADATIGVHPIEDTCLNHRYCLPNKLFEYLQAGLPVVVSDLPEMAVIVHRYQVGRTFRNGDARSLADTLNVLVGDGSALERYRRAARIAAGELRWEREESKLLEVYAGLAGPP